MSNYKPKKTKEKLLTRLLDYNQMKKRPTGTIRPAQCGGDIRECLDHEFIWLKRAE
jgi:hypothetical protein